MGGLGIYISGGGGGGSPGIVKVADEAARLALSPAQGDYVVQLDDGTLWYYNGTGWELQADGGAVLYIRNSDSVNLNLAANDPPYTGDTNTLDAEVRLSAEPADAGYVLGELLIDSGPSFGLRSQLEVAALETALAKTPNTFAGYADITGVLGSIPQWTFTSEGRTDVDVNITPPDSGSALTYQIHRKEFTLTPSGPLNDNYWHEAVQINLNGSNNFEQVIGHNLEIYKTDSSNVDSWIGKRTYMQLSDTSGVVNDTIANDVQVTMGDSTNASSSNNIYLDRKNLFIQDDHTASNTYGVYLIAGSDTTGEATSYTAFSSVGGWSGPLDDYLGVTLSPTFSQNLNSFTGYNMNPQVDATISNFTGYNIQGYSTGDVTNFTAFSSNPNMSGTITNYQGLGVGSSSATSITNALGVNIYMDSAATIPSYTAVNSALQVAADNYNGVVLVTGGDGTNFIGYSANPSNNFSSYQGLGASPSGDMDNFLGVAIQPSGDGTNFTGMTINPPGGTYSGSLGGLNIDLSSVTLSPSISNPTGRKSGLNISQGSVTIGGDFQTVSSSPFLVDNAHLITNNFNIVSGTPITGTDFLGANLSATLNAQDDMGTSAFGLGWGAVGLVGQLQVANTRTVQSGSFMIAGGSVPVGSTGGTITDLHMYRALGIAPAGGSLNVTNMYGFKYENALGFTPTNEWGVHVANANAENYFEKSVSIGQAQTTNSSVGLELAGTTKAFRMSRLTTVQRDALTPLEGMEIFNTTTGRTEYYDGTVWQAGDGSLVVFNTAQSLSAAGTITASQNRRQRRRVAGNAAAVTASSTTAITAGVYDGQELYIVGTDDTNTVTIPNSGNVKLNGSVTLGLDDMIYLIWDANDSKWAEVSRSE